MSRYSRLRNALRPGRLDKDLAEELEDHLARRSADLATKGMNADQARRQASLRFGNATLIRERSREARLSSTLEGFFQDARYAWRGMRKSPAFTLTAILSLSVAIGANTAIFSIIDAAILRKLPLPHPEQLVTFALPEIQEPGSQSAEESPAFSYPVYQAFRSAAGETARLALTGFAGVSELQEGGPDSPRRKVVQQWLSADTFDILGVTPALGRLFSLESDNKVGAAPYAVLSYDFWQSHYSGQADIIGKTIRFGDQQFQNDRRFQIIGVARKGFFGVEPGRLVDIWTPVAMYNPEALVQAGWSFFSITGRLAAGANQRLLQQRLQPILLSFSIEAIKRHPSMSPAIRRQYATMQLRVHSASTGTSQFRVSFSRPLWIVLGVAAGILLIACANIASLLLARSAARAPEMAMRISVGAGRSRLVRQLLTECMVLSLFTGVFGWLIGRVTAPALVGILSTRDNPVQFSLISDARIFFFCAAITTLATVLFGLLPAWQASRTEPMLVLRRASGQSHKLNMGRFFVGVQVAFAFCLLMAGTSFLFSLRNLLMVNPGFDPRSVTVFSMVDEAGPEAKRRALMDQIQHRAATLPGVRAAAIAAWSIFGGTAWTEQILIPGHAPSEREELFYNVSPGYFTTLRTPLLAGRDFTPQEAGGMNPVPAIVNRAFERKYLSTEGGLNRVFERPEKTNRIRHRIVGIAADSRYGDLHTGPQPLIYVPLEGRNDFALYIRSDLPLSTLAQFVARETKNLGSGMHVATVTPLETVVGQTILKEKVLAGIGGTFALLGLVLAAIGLFGLLSYSVARRTKELGIRGAVGARQGQLVSLVFRDVVVLLGAGLLAGLLASGVLLVGLRSLFFGIKTLDPAVVITAVSIFCFAAALAAGIPARRAAAVDPMIALRQE